MTEKNKGGRPPHKPTSEQRAQVEALTACGVSQAAISRIIGVDQKTLHVHYRDELDLGLDKANAQVAGKLFRTAMGNSPGALTAMIFWLKTRARWRTTDQVQVTGPNGGPMQIIDPAALAGMSETELATLESVLARIAGAPVDGAGLGEAGEGEA